MKKKWLFQCVLAAALTACGGGGDEDDEGGSTGGDCGGLTYTGFAKPVFDTNCISCHGATTAATLGKNARLDSLDGVKTHKDHIIAHAVELKAPIMPLGSTTGLPEDTRMKLKQWLTCGAPQ